MPEIANIDRPSEAGRLQRRTLLKGAATGALLMVVDLSQAAPAGKTGLPPSVDLNALVQIGPGDTVTLVMPRVEMGQGAYTALSQLIAEELEVDPARVQLSHAPADDTRYANPALGAQVTGGSTSVATAWLPMRRAGAAARMMLIQAAAEQWRVPPSACRAENGEVLHPQTGRRAAYGALADAAARLPVPTELQLKDPRDFRYVGQPLLRLDAPAKVSGTAQFGIDVRIPGMLIAAVSASPYFGGHVKSLDAAAARKVRGVRQVLNLGDVVAVLADHNGAARKGLAAANIQWRPGAAASYSTATMEAELETASRGSGVTARVQGDVEAAASGGAHTLEAIYQQPLMAHAAMEPMNCTVRLGADRCEIWTGTQVPTRAQAAAAQAAGLKPEQVVVHNQFLGGGFGRRLDVDIVPQAVRIAKAARVPVKVIWSREEDIQHDVYRPYHFNRLSATLDAQGHPIAWQHRVTGSSIMARFAPAAFQGGIDGDAIRDAAGPYDFAHLRVQYVRQEPPAGLLTGWWRGVGHMQNAFPVECFLDELAQAGGQDPLQLRLGLLDKHPRAQHVLRLLAEKAQWGRKLPPGQGRGLALTQAFGTYAAQVTDVAVDADGTVRVLRVVTVVDCGAVVTPSTVEAQVQGGNVFGLSAVLFGNITVKDGRIEQSNFHDFRVMRMSEVPVMETHLVPSAEAPTGIGEIATVLSAPSVVNAVFAATGKRVRKLPLDAALLRSA